MKDPLLHFQMERAMQPAFDRIRVAAMEFAERVSGLEVSPVLCHCPGRPPGHVWNPTPGWCPNPQQVQGD